MSGANAPLLQGVVSSDKSTQQVEGQPHPPQPFNHAASPGTYAAMPQQAPYQQQPYQAAPYQAYQAGPYQAVPYPAASYQVIVPQMVAPTVLVNPCTTCGAPAAARCTFGISRGDQCTQLMCILHNQSVPGPRGGAYPHCPAHGAMLAQRRAAFRQSFQQGGCCLMCTIM